MFSFPLPGVLAPRLLGKLRDWADDKRGIAAVEFALIAIPFFFLIFGLLEVALLFIMTTVMEHAVNEASREIRTGRFQAVHGAKTAAEMETAFRDLVCPELFGLLSCGSTKMKIDIKEFNSFGVATNTNPIKPDQTLDTAGFGVVSGAPDRIMVVRVFYEWDLITPVLSKPLENLAGGKHLLSAVAVFKNEPFGS
jgi:Flp pilus assembly protein TadG